VAVELERVQWRGGAGRVISGKGKYDLQTSELELRENNNVHQGHKMADKFYLAKIRTKQS